MKLVGVVVLVLAYLVVPVRSAHADSGAQTMFELLNQARARGANCGGRRYGAAPPLKRHAGLNRAARKWARQMLRSGQFAHSLGGSTFVKRIFAACGRTAAAENLSGNRSARDAVRRLMRSPGHCRNIMNLRHRYVGIGKAIGGRYGAYWVQNFASRC